jgi:hypothetical protein
MTSIYAITVALTLVGASSAIPQTNASARSAVGTWRLDVTQSKLASGPVPKSFTLTILKDTPQMNSWRVDVLDDSGAAFSYSWSGPADGTMQSLKSADGTEIGKQSLKRIGNVLLYHGKDPTDGRSFDGRSTMSADGDTIINVVTARTKDGKISQDTFVMHRFPASR